MFKDKTWVVKITEVIFEGTILHISLYIQFVNTPQTVDGKQLVHQALLLGFTGILCWGVSSDSPLFWASMHKAAFTVVRGELVAFVKCTENGRDLSNIKYILSILSFGIIYSYHNKYYCHLLFCPYVLSAYLHSWKICSWEACFLYLLIWFSIRLEETLLFWIKLTCSKSKCKNF